jgi:hypothetical protein
MTATDRRRCRRSRIDADGRPGGRAALEGGKGRGDDVGPHIATRPEIDPHPPGPSFAGLRMTAAPGEAETTSEWVKERLT